MVRVVSEDMVDNEVFDKSVLDSLVSEASELSKAQIELAKLMVEVEVEKLKVEAKTERLKIEVETQIKLVRINQETRVREIQEKRMRREEERNNFDLTKQIRLVPKFNEEDVDNYFQHFEKIASSLEWPIEAWPTLL